MAEHDSIEAELRLPEDLARDLARVGLFRTFLPAAYGGLDLAPAEGLEVFEELARADASVAWCVMERKHALDRGAAFAGRGARYQHRTGRDHRQTARGHRDERRLFPADFG